ncbi:HWE histidine kinase domain-containing protein [Martelella sp. HB161492]|uniref:HWE histidine kinase domain-containing protein n=1 Tax=Martelella sp. HB161492 TaxID=2720726 RepID=UPI0015917747
MKHLPQELVEAIKDESRLRILSQYILRSEDGDADFDTVTSQAARLLSVPFAFLMIIDFDRNWVQSASGMDISDVETEKGLSAYPIAGGVEPALEIHNPQEDPRFLRSVPEYQGQVAVFFVGAPVYVHGVKAGTLCVFDTKPHEKTPVETLVALRRIADLAGSLYELKDAARGKASADLALSRAETRHSLALRAANIAAWSWDGTSEAIECDNTLRAMFDLPVGEPVTFRKALDAIAPSMRASTMRAFKGALSRGEEYQGEVRVSSSGRWLLALGRTYDNPVSQRGGTRPVFGVVVDITATKASEEKTRLLLRELNHRVKNTLAIVQSIASQTLRRSRSSAEFTMSFSARLQALSLAHTLLSDEQWGAIEVERLLRSQIAPYTDRFDRQIEIDGDTVYLDPDEALALGLVIHELASNAAKFGALTAERGMVKIAVRRVVGKQGRYLDLSWQEVGGPPVAVPDQQGFGSVLIKRSLDKVVGSRVDVSYARSGLEVHITMPLRTR